MTHAEMISALKVCNPENKAMGLQFMAEQWWPEAKWLNATVNHHNGGAKKGGRVASAHAAKLAKKGLLTLLDGSPVTYIINT